MSVLNCEKVASHIIDWLNNYIKDIPVKGFIVGLSGGVDSALVASLCARTHKKVILLSMPIHQADVEYFRAQQQIKRIEKDYPNVEGVEIDLTQSFVSFEES